MWVSTIADAGLGINLLLNPPEEKTSQRRKGREKEGEKTPAAACPLALLPTSTAVSTHVHVACRLPAADRRPARAQTSHVSSPAGGRPAPAANVALHSTAARQHDHRRRQFPVSLADRGHAVRLRRRSVVGGQYYDQHVSPTGTNGVVLELEVAARSAATAYAHR